MASRPGPDRHPHQVRSQTVRRAQLEKRCRQHPSAPDGPATAGLTPAALPVIGSRPCRRVCPELSIWGPGVEQPTKRLTIFQINATVAAGGALALCAAFVMSRILPAILWAFVLAIALWPTFQRVQRWKSSRRWHRIGAPAALTLLIALVV